jgi:hypothetical protein
MLKVQNRFKKINNKAELSALGSLSKTLCMCNWKIAQLCPSPMDLHTSFSQCFLKLALALTNATQIVNLFHTQAISRIKPVITERVASVNLPQYLSTALSMMTGLIQDIAHTHTIITWSKLSAGAKHCCWMYAGARRISPREGMSSSELCTEGNNPGWVT